MPAKKKRQRRLRPYEKVQNFLDLYKQMCENVYDVPRIDKVMELYDPIVEKRVKSLRRVPQIFQIADEPVDPTHIRPLVDCYKKSEVRIRFFSFLNTNSGDEGLHMLSHVLEPPMEVAGIAYHANNVGPSGCRVIGRCLKAAPSLAVLELDFNPGIGDDGVAGLCNYGHCPTLTTLSLRFCEIADKGAAALGKWIAQPECQVKNLLINGNKIGPPGVVAFAAGLAENKSIVRIDMSDNLFGYDAPALTALHDGIQACTSIQGINMLNHFECPEGMAQKFFELTQTKPLGECTLTVKMDTYTFQNTKQNALVNKRKMARDAKKARLAARKNKGQPPPATPAAGTVETNSAPPPATSNAETSPADQPAATNIAADNAQPATGA